MKSIRISKRAPLLAAAFAGFALAPSELAAQGTVVGGSKNAAPGGISVVVGGAKNRSVGGGSVIVGGNTNRANGDNSAIVTGFQNTTGTTGKFSGIGAGSNNLITGQGSFIGSGNKNTASGLSTIVLGGTDNTCAGQFSVIAGGRRNTLNATESFLFGNDIDFDGTRTGIVYLADNSRGGTPLFHDPNSNSMQCRFDNGLEFYADPTSSNPDFTITPTGNVDARGTLTVDGNATVEGKSVAVGEESLRLIRGEVGPGSELLQGSGFSADKNGTGRYIITFDTLFSGVATPVATAVDSANNKVAMVSSLSTTGFVVIIKDETDAIVDSNFTFIVMGPR